MKKVLFIMLAAALLSPACAPKQAKIPAIDLANLDTSVSPGEDFYQYATGGWQKNHPLKPEFSRYGSFDVIAENAQKNLNDLFAAMSEMHPKKGTVDQKIVDLYKMGLDSLRRNADGAAPLKEQIAAIEAVGTKEDLVLLLARLHDGGDDGFFGAGVEADLMDSNNQILYMGQGGLGMGNRDYYIKSENDSLKAGYRNFLIKVFTLSGLDRPEERADNALWVEERMAEFSWSREQNRDMYKLYNPMSTDQIVKNYPALMLDKYFSTRGIPAQDKVILQQPSFFEGLDALVARTETAVLKDYLLGQLIHGATGALSDDFYTASWEFFSHQMAGAKEQTPRWKRAMSVPNGILGEAVGKMYVEKYFPESSKQRMVELVDNLKAALSEHIDALEWMGDTTKVKAHEKLDNFTVKIGYPDKWKDYSTLEIDPEKSYYENLRAASRWYVADNMSRLGKPTDKTEWGMTPQTVNAYYNPTTNEICFPAGILQPPFFNPDADDAVNYGGIGVVIGHEISHGFDDQGRLFDKDGNMVSWWTAADEARFNALADKLVAQFDEVEVAPGVHANGRVTLGENIGDHGGLSIAYTAMENALKAKGDPGLIDGFTPQQRFWLSYGAIWAANITDQEILRRTNMDVHSLGRNRVNVSIRNFQEFFDAFGIKEGDKMYRPESERVHIW